MKRFFYALAFLAGAFAPVARAQTLDSVKVDSVPFVTTNYDIIERSFYTKTVQSPPDTVIVDAPLPSGTDTMVKGDTTFFTYWHTGRLTDSMKFRVSAPAPALGKPYGPSGLLDATTVAPFTYSGGESAGPGWILDVIAEARAKRVKIVLNLPCGGHSSITGGKCMSLVDSVWTFDRAKFDAEMARYNTPEIKSAVALAVKDGVVLGVNLMDEPWVSGGDDGAGTVVPNSWGRRGTMTRARVDSLCTVSKGIFPTAPAGTSDHLTAFDPTHDFAVCDIGFVQYSNRFGSITVWRDATLERARRGGYNMVYSFNVLNGGTQDRDGTYDCAAQGGVKGTRQPNCGMTPTQILTAVRELGDAGCGGLMMWRYDATKYARPDWAQAFRDAAAIQALRVQKPCTLR